jgi:hypothetical protein
MIDLQVLLTLLLTAILSGAGYGYAMWRRETLRVLARGGLPEVFLWRKFARTLMFSITVGVLFRLTVELGPLLGLDPAILTFDAVSAWFVNVGGLTLLDAFYNWVRHRRFLRAVRG